MSQHLIIPIVLVVVAYLLGSVSSAILVSKLFQLPDPRTQGSNNPGATNVLRIGGRLPALVTLLGDALKGLVPVLLLKWMDTSLLWQVIGMASAFLGHLYPCFFQFRGGKGVATLLGGLMGLSWILGLVFISIWLLTVAIFRISALGAIIASISIPPIAGWLLNGRVATVLLVLVILLLWRHRQNIQGMLHGR